MRKPTRIQKPKETQPEQKSPLAPRGGFRYADVVRISNDLSKALPELDAFSHRWALYVLDVLKPFVKNHYATLAKHKDHMAYEKARGVLAAVARKNEKDMIPADKMAALAGDYPEYTKNLARLLSGDCEAEFRPFRSEWLAETATSSTLSRLLIDYDLMDRPVAAAMEDLLYGENEAE